MKNQKLFGAIVLAAGKGKRMNSKDINKVVMPLQNKPMISYTIDLLEGLKIKDIIVVVGFAKESVMNILKGRVQFAQQRKRLGTGHAVVCALEKVPSSVTDVIVLNGDDSAFYTKKLINSLIQKHISTDASVTFLTLKTNNPFGLGRVIRDKKGNVKGIVEEKDATEEQKKINEILTGCYLFDLSFLKNYIKKIPKSPVTKEYYIVHLINLAAEDGKKIETQTDDTINWRGVNTEEELQEAEKLFISKAA